MKKGHVPRLRKLYSWKGTVEILEYVDNNPACEISDLEKVATPFVVGKRLRTFRRQRGKEVLAILGELTEVQTM